MQKYKIIMKNNETLPKIAHNKGHKYVQRDAEMYTLWYKPRIRVFPKIAHNKGHKYVQRDEEMYTLLYEPRIRVFPKIAHEYVQSEVHIMLRAR